MAAPKGFDIPASIRGTWAQSMTDMYHDPNLVLLLSEYVEDSWAHGAKHIELTLEQGGHWHERIRAGSPHGSYSCRQ